MQTFEKYKTLGIDGSRINLEYIPDAGRQFCTPIGFIPVGNENDIQYGFIEGFGDMIFAVNPMSSVDDNVYPLAVNFCDFLRLILACRSTTPIEQIVWMSEEMFDSFMKDEENITIEGSDEVLTVIKSEFNLTPMENPYDYVKQVQNAFKYNERKVEFDDEYYEVTGRPRPDGTYAESGGFEFAPVEFTFTTK